MSEDGIGERLLSVAEVAEKLAIGERTIQRWASAGKFPRQIKLSAGIARWRLSDVDAWLTEQAAA